MTETGRRGGPKDHACPHCGVLFAKNNLPMHVAAKHGGSSPAAASAPAHAPASRTRAVRAPASTPPPEAPPAKREYDVLDDSTW